VALASAKEELAFEARPFLPYLPRAGSWGDKVPRTNRRSRLKNRAATLAPERLQEYYEEFLLECGYTHGGATSAIGSDFLDAGWSGGCPSSSCDSAIHSSVSRI
jgi:hypothetical protein